MCVVVNTRSLQQGHSFSVLGLCISKCTSQNLNFNRLFKFLTFLLLILSFPGIKMAYHTIESEMDLRSLADTSRNPSVSKLSTATSKGRISYITPTEHDSDKQILTFRHTTKAQERTRKRQQPVKLEPLVS